MSEPLEALRAVNVTLTLLTAAVLFIRLNDLWRTFTVGRRTVLAGLFSLLLVGAYGSAESYVQHAPAGARTPAITLVCGVILLGLWLSRHDDR
ncbi:hypothetical protein [Nocardioides kribbensis]|uniref:DUF202 domain-containing protein n=1 Tax=Nocardioides kribbensis TaxID=305517 RepID=A0ABV1NYX5_9ACTN